MTTSRTKYFIALKLAVIIVLLALSCNNYKSEKPDIENRLNKNYSSLCDRSLVEIRSLADVLVLEMHYIDSAKSATYYHNITEVLRTTEALVHATQLRTTRSEEVRVNDEYYFAKYEDYKGSLRNLDMESYAVNDDDFQWFCRYSQQPLSDDLISVSLDMQAQIVLSTLNTCTKLCNAMALDIMNCREMSENEIKEM